MSRFRYALKRRFAFLMMPIVAGPLRGAWWSLFSGIRFLRGRYDRSLIEHFATLIDDGDVVYDVGAHIGYYSLVASQRVGRRGTVVAFEPLPLNLAFLRRHLRANQVGNVTVIDACVSDTQCDAAFDFGKGTGRGRLASRGDIAVKTVTLDDLVRSGQLPPPTLIKMDIEGAELAALHGARALLRRYRPQLLLSVHGLAMDRDCRTLLHELGYQLRAYQRSTYLAEPLERTASDAGKRPRPIPARLGAVPA